MFSLEHYFLFLKKKPRGVPGLEAQSDWETNIGSQFIDKLQRPLFRRELSAFHDQLARACQADVRELATRRRFAMRVVHSAAFIDNFLVNVAQDAESLQQQFDFILGEGLHWLINDDLRPAFQA